MEPGEAADKAARDRRRLRLVVGGIVVVVLATWGIVAAVSDRGPEETVEDFLTAVAEEDVDAALALVTRTGYGVPYGDDAAFLTPEAINGDWWVASVTETNREYSSKATVKAVIAGPGGSAEGEFTVYESDDEWLLSDPFVRVRFPNSPLNFLRVNDEIVSRAELAASNDEFELFPGLYRFYQPVAGVVDTEDTEQVAAFPLPEGASYDDRPTVVPAALTPGKRALEGLRTAVRQRIDECAAFETPAPAGGCPFLTDGEIDTPDGRRVSDIHGLKWTVASYPEVTMTDDRSDEHRPGFALTEERPGTVTLTGTGTDTEDRPVTFTVTCAIELTGATATVGADGGVTIDVSQNREVTDTCRQS